MWVWCEFGNRMWRWSCWCECCASRGLSSLAFVVSLQTDKLSTYNSYIQHLGGINCFELSWCKCLVYILKCRQFRPKIATVGKEVCKQLSYDVKRATTWFFALACDSVALLTLVLLLDVIFKPRCGKICVWDNAVWKDKICLEISKGLGKNVAGFGPSRRF